jgi:ABC-2 type transport system permease protein
MFKLIYIELKRNGISFIRYPAEAVVMVITFTAVFLLLFMGVSYMSGPTALIGERLDAVIVSYILFSLVLLSVLSMGNEFQTEATTGTLEQVFQSPFGPIKVFFVRAVTGLIFKAAIIGGCLAVILILTGRILHFSFGIIPPVLAVLLGAYGIGFMIGALAVLIKRIQNLLQLVQFLMFLPLMVATEAWQSPWRELGYLIPMSPGSGMLRDIMARGAAFDFAQFGAALLNGVLYLALGILAFRLADRKARREGRLSGY